MLTTYGNSIPKLPRVSKRIAAFNLDPWQSARSRRLAGRLTVAFGLFQVIAAVLLPVRAITPVIMVLCLVYLRRDLLARVLAEARTVTTAVMLEQCWQRGMSR